MRGVVSSEVNGRRWEDRLEDSILWKGETVYRDILRMNFDGSFNLLHISCSDFGYVFCPNKIKSFN